MKITQNTLSYSTFITHSFPPSLSKHTLFDPFLKIYLHRSILQSKKIMFKM